METSVRHQLVWFTYGWTDTNRFHNRTNGHKPSSQIPSQIHRNPEGLEALGSRSATRCTGTGTMHVPPLEDDGTRPDH